MPKSLVRNSLGLPLLCCWDECGQYGDDRVKEIVTEGRKKVAYIFCSEGHRAYWKHSTKSYGNRPSGDRTPAGLIIPGR